MEYSVINIEPKLTSVLKKQLNGKRKIKDYCLNIAIAKCQICLANFDLVEATQANMQELMLDKINKENSTQTGFFVTLSKSRKDLKGEIILTLKSEVYEL